MKRVRLTVLCASALLVSTCSSGDLRAPREEVAAHLPMRVEAQPELLAIAPEPPVVPPAPAVAPVPRAVPLIPVVACAPSPRAISPDPRSLIVPLAATTKARELVTLLGSDEFPTREDATGDLAQMGRFARPVLLDSLNTHPDPEVRARCARLLPGANEADQAARLSAFLADTEARFEHDIPGTRTFRECVGDTKEIRALAAAVLPRPERRALFAKIERGMTLGGVALVEWRRGLYLEQSGDSSKPGRKLEARYLTLEEITSILVAEIAVPSVHHPAMVPHWWTDGCQFVGTRSSREAMSGTGPHAAAYRKVVATWIETRRSPRELRALPDRLFQELASFKESQPAMARIVNTPGVEFSAKCQVMTTLARLHPAEQSLAILVPALKDESVLQMVRFPKPDGTVDVYPCRVQDVARALILFMGKEDVDSYGFEYPSVYGTGRLVDPHFVGGGGYAFRTEERRATAAMKFAWWRLRESVK